MGDFNYCANLYASFDALSRGEAEDEGRQALEMPDFGLFDFGFLYKFPIGGLKAMLNARVQNAFDTEYIPDALDAETMEEALVYYGFGRTWVIGIKFMFQAKDGITIMKNTIIKLFTLILAITLVIACDPMEEI